MKKEEILNLSGTKFGRLTVIEVIQIPSKLFKYSLKCECECGNIRYYTVKNLKKNLSCGCLRKEKWCKAYYTWAKNQEKMI